MKYSDYIYYVGNIPYQLWQMERIFRRLGGTPLLPGYEGEVKGVCLFANQINPVEPNKNIVKVLVGHGTSNKQIMTWFDGRGKNLYDYYWTSGPKWRAVLDHFGHYVEGKEVKVGNLRFDWYFQEYTKKKALEIFKIKDDRKIVIFAPTFNRHTIEHNDAIFKPLLEKYHVILKGHPIVKVNLNRTHKRLKVFEGDIADILWAADLLISDESSVAYDFTITGRPIVLCPPIATTTFVDDDKYNIMKHVPIYHYWEKEDIVEKIEEAESRTDEVEQLCKDVFWYQDGYAADRACKWLKKIIDERFT